MRLGWDEIARRAKAFAEDWKDARYEKGETQSFYNDFFEIFGVRRRTVAVYEQRVKLLDDKRALPDPPPELEALYRGQKLRVQIPGDPSTGASACK